MGVACSPLISPPGAPPLPSVVRQERLAKTRPALVKVAVVPLTAADAAELPVDINAPGLVGRQLTAALQAKGLVAVPPREVGLALAAVGMTEGWDDPERVAPLVAEKLGATGVIVGELVRFRDRRGRALAASEPASVAFRLRLYSAPEGVELWRVRFDRTQQPLSDRPRDGSRLPGGGVRWVTGSELSEWGVGHAVHALTSGP
jgi:hypothetical protein